MAAKAQLRSVDGLLAPAVAEMLTTLDLSPEDAAAARLAKKYAEAIDDGDAETLEKIGPKLLAALESLGGTPKARSLIKKGGAASGGQGKIQAIRAAR